MSALALDTVLGENANAELGDGSEDGLTVEMESVEVEPNVPTDCEEKLEIDNVGLPDGI